MKQRLTIELRHKQIYYKLDINQPVIIQCNPDGTASYVPGTVPGNTWIDFTDHTEGLDQLTLNWQAKSSESVDNEDAHNTDIGSNYQKGLTAEIKFFAEAYQYIYDWLMTGPCQILNSIEARITDLECQKTLRIFEVKLDNIKYSPKNEPCIVSIPLREADEVWHSFYKTIIEDDWNHWFNSDGTSTKEHPTFGMIVEKKPKMFLVFYVVLIYALGMLSVGSLIALNEGKRWIRRSLGFTYFSPSPLIRDFIQNICDKYGYTFDTIFDDMVINPYRDLCLFFPVGSTYSNFNESFDSPSTKYIWENRTAYSFVVFLNMMKKVFNAEWYVTPNKKLVFKHKSFFDNQAPLYDFTIAGADILWNLSYSFNGTKKPAYGDYNFRTDPQDVCSPEIKWRYNSIVDYDGPYENPMFEGHITKDFEFGTTCFQKDGTSKDFLEESIKVGRLIALGVMTFGFGKLFFTSNPLTALIVAAALFAGYLVTNNYMDDFFNEDALKGMVRVSNAEINVPRLLLWDRTTQKASAKVVSVVNPTKNSLYNVANNDYYQEHPAFDAAGYFQMGSDVEKIYNYPCYIDEKFTGNLYDRFHEYDNPLHNPTINQTWEGQVDLCCEWLDRLGVWDGDYIKIGAVILLELRGTRKIKGRIEEIDINYKDGSINLKGTVLK